MRVSLEAVVTFASREAVLHFRRRYYRRTMRWEQPARTGVAAPDDWADRLRKLRQRLCLSQRMLATQIGAANKAVVYQWESGRRRPSAVLWQRVEHLAQSQ